MKKFNKNVTALTVATFATVAIISGTVVLISTIHKQNNIAIDNADIPSVTSTSYSNTTTSTTTATITTTTSTVADTSKITTTTTTIPITTTTSITSTTSNIDIVTPISMVDFVVTPRLTTDTETTTVESEYYVEEEEPEVSEESIEPIYEDVEESVLESSEVLPEIVYEESSIEESYEEEYESSHDDTEYSEEYEDTYDDISSDMTYLGNMRITGYVATGNPTASGEYPYVGGIAMSTSYGLPYGTTIYIEGLGYYTLNDTGCAYGVVDVFCNTVSECYALTSYADVYVVN